MIMKGSSLKGSGLIVIFLLTLFLLQPVLVDAQFDKEGLESLITRTNKRRDTAEKVAVFKGIMANHYYISASVVDEILKDLPPGEALAAVSISSLSKKDAQEIAKMKKAGEDWPQIAEKNGITLKDVIRDIRKFQRTSG